MPDRDALLTRVFELAVEARDQGDHPFGALLVGAGEGVAEALNRVNTGRDLTAHAETELVRLLERDGRLAELSEGTVYASCEPCPMCVGAMFWAGARSVVYGLSTERLNELAAPPGGEPFGFTIDAPALGRSTMPPMTFDWPPREDEAAQAHLGFWGA